MNKFALQVIVVLATWAGAAQAFVGRFPPSLPGAGTGARRCYAENSKNSPATEAKVWPVQLSVFAQMIGEGIAISSLPLHMTRHLGATPVEVGLAVSCFSAAQLVCCPLLVELSERYGRLRLLSVCLAGATASNVGIALASTVPAITACRFVSGAFAASVPVAQATVTESSAKAAPVALSRLAATSQSAIVLGPLVAAALIDLQRRLGVDPSLRLRFVFGGTAVFACAVLGILAPRPEPLRVERSAAVKTRASGRTVAAAQPLLRTIALVVGWSLTLSVYGYGLFAPRFLGYDQARLSATYSAGALATISAQVGFPMLVGFVGEHLSATAGLLTLSVCLAGQSLLRSAPLHTAFYLANRVGSGIADTAVAVLVSTYSGDDRDRAKNLGYIQSTRAATRIVTPPLSGTLFALSCGYARHPGSLPFLANAACALLVTPVPILLNRLGRQRAAGQPAR